MISKNLLSFYREFESRNIKVSVEMEEKQRYIIADQIQFNRILNNLIQNALKYAQCEFEIRQSYSDGKCYIQFKNDRHSIKEGELKAIFDRFYTGDAARSHGSTGLGLTITKALVEKMKGSIEGKLEEDYFVIELVWNMQE